jgi:hypothetical protein
MLNIDYSTKKRFWMSLGLTMIFLGGMIMSGILIYEENMNREFKNNVENNVEILKEIEILKIEGIDTSNYEEGRKFINGLDETKNIVDKTNMKISSIIATILILGGVFIFGFSLIWVKDYKWR